MVHIKLSDMNYYDGYGLSLEQLGGIRCIFLLTMLHGQD